MRKKECSNSQNAVLEVTDSTALGYAERVLTPVIVTMWTGNVLKVVNLVGSQSCVKKVYNETHITSVDNLFTFDLNVILFYLKYTSYISVSLCILLMIFFVACKNGTYGVQCRNECSGNCLNNEPCNKITGNCETCLPGWKEPLCNESESKKNH